AAAPRRPEAGERIVRRLRTAVVDARAGHRRSVGGEQRDLDRAALVERDGLLDVGLRELDRLAVERRVAVLLDADLPAAPGRAVEPRPAVLVGRGGLG